MNPCWLVLRHATHRTAATLRAWGAWARLHPSWHAPVLALVACAGVAGAPLPAGPAPTAMPWIGAPGWVRHTNTMPGYGPQTNGWGTLPGLSAGSLYTSQPLYLSAPVVNTPAEWANLVLRQKARERLALPSNEIDTSPVSVPEPATVALLALGIVGAVLGRRMAL